MKHSDSWFFLRVHLISFEPWCTLGERQVSGPRGTTASCPSPAEKGMQCPGGCHLSGSHGWAPMCILPLPCDRCSVCECWSTECYVQCFEEWKKTQLAYCIPVNGKSQLKLNDPVLGKDKKEWEVVFCSSKLDHTFNHWFLICSYLNRACFCIADMSMI